MTIRWSCPGSPRCRKIFLYAQGLKAHMAACRHAQHRRVQARHDEVHTMLAIIQFVEDQQKGNVTVARKSVPSFKKESAVYQRI